MIKEHEKLLKEIIPYIKINAGKFANGNGYYYEELISAGTIGAYKCIDTWDSTKSSLKTYMINNSKYSQLNKLRDLKHDDCMTTNVNDIEQFSIEEDVNQVSEEYKYSLKIVLEKLKSSQNERDLSILTDYYGFTNDAMTMEMVGKKHGISTERVKQIIQRLQHILKKAIKSQNIQNNFTKK